MMFFESRDFWLLVGMYMSAGIGIGIEEFINNEGWVEFAKEALISLETNPFLKFIDVVGDSIKIILLVCVPAIFWPLTLGVSVYHKVIKPIKETEEDEEEEE